MSAGEQLLFDIVESNQLVVFTGAGFSFQFVGRDGRRLPGWKTLLQQIRTEMQASGTRFGSDSGASPEELLDSFLGEEIPRGEHLIEAATILKKADPDRFAELVQRFLTPADPQDPAVMHEYDRKHEAVLKLEPCGIVTVNVDAFHEDYLRRAGRTSWRFHDAMNGSPAEAAEIIRSTDRQQFLVKAHGTLGGKIVFDYHAYRDLLERTPSYTALFHYLFSQNRILFIGFGLSDLDFDSLIDAAVRQFGSPLQNHLTLEVKKPAPVTESDRIRATLSAARSARLRERFGIATLEVEADEIPALLERAARMPGVSLQNTIARCSSTDVSDRRKAHRDLRALGTAGKRIAMHVLYGQVRAALDAAVAPLGSTELHDLSELTYSLGHIDPDPDDRLALASQLLDIVEATRETEIVAHALWALVSLVQFADVDRLCRIRDSGRVDPAQLIANANFRAGPARCRQYLDALIARAAAEAA